MRIRYAAILIACLGLASAMMILVAQCDGTQTRPNVANSQRSPVPARTNPLLDDRNPIGALDRQEAKLSRDSVSSDNAKASQGPSTTCLLQGSVTRRDGSPVDDAWVSLCFNQGDVYPLRDTLALRTAKVEGTTTTDVKGRFQFTVRRDCPYRLVAGTDELAGAPAMRCWGGQDVNIVLDKASSMICTIIDSKSGEPIPDASVTVLGGVVDLASAISDIRGGVTLANLPAGQAGIGVRKSGYVPRTEVYELIAGYESRVVIELVRQEMIRGRVTDALTGQAICGATVVISRSGYEGTRTDSEGRYAIHGGRLDWVEVQGPGYARAARLVGDGDAGILDFGLQGGGSIKGVVVNQDGQALGQVFVEVWSDEDAELGYMDAWQGISGPDGRFQFDSLYLNREYCLTFRKPGFGLETMSVKASDASSVRDIGRVELFAGSYVEGTVVGSEGDSVVEGTVVLECAEEKTDSKHANRERITMPRQAATDRAGRFRFCDVAPGNFRVHVSSVSVESEEVVSLQAGERVVNLKLKLARAPR